MNHGASRFRRRALSLLAGAVLLVPILGVGVAQAVAPTTDSNDPSFWPTSAGLNPNIETTAHSIRYAGNSRSETNFATGLAMVGECDYPFDSADHNGDSGTGLNATDCWYGTDGSPASIIVTAKDKFADSLTASAISAPGNAHAGPTQLPNINNPSSLDSPPTEDSPIVITDSTREGASSLSPTADRLARFMNSCVAPSNGPCTENAIIVGGTGSVPTGVEGELTTMGYDNVYRIGGIDRNDTAKKEAQALGTGAAGPFHGDNTCVDSDARDGTNPSFQSNAAPEFWTDATHCNYLPQTVILADGGTGADALAIGWFASYWGVPILLVNADGSISSFTQSALQTLPIQNIIVAGGTGRITDVVAGQAAGFAGISADHVHRVADTNRTKTSIQMAMHLGGWFPQGNTIFKDALFCVASSSGEGDGSTGWPDDLGAAPVCGDAAGQADNYGAPSRLLPPANGSQDTFVSDSRVHDWVPMFLNPVGGALDSDLSAFLAQIFPTSPTGGKTWCDNNTAASCDDPGFGITFGGTGAVSDGAFHSIATLASGGKYTTFGDLAPTVDPFFTRLNVSAVYTNGNSGSGGRVCANRNALHDVEFLAVYDDPALNTLNNHYDVADNSGYDQTAGAQSLPVCVGFSSDTDGVSEFTGISVSGNQSEIIPTNYSDANSLNMSGQLSSASQVSASGADSHLDDATVEGQSTHEVFALGTGGTTKVAGTTCTNSATGSTLDVTITRNADFTKVPDTFSGTFTLATSCGTYTGTATGEAQLSGGNWTLRGMSTFTGGTGTPAFTGGVGGFTSTLTTSGNTSLADDTITGFQVDGIQGAGFG